MEWKEIDDLILKGVSLTMTFGIRKHYYSIGEKPITKKQFDSAKKRFEDKLIFSGVYGGLTRHYYKLNPITTNP